MRVEDVLSVLHVQHGIAAIGAIVIRRRKVDRDLACIAEDRGGEAMDALDAAGAKRRAALLAAEDPPERGGESF